MASLQITRQTLRASIRRSTQTRSYRTFRPNLFRDHLRVPVLHSTLPAPRTFHSTAQNAAVKLPESNVAQPEPEEHEQSPSEKTELTIEEYHLRADEFIEALQARLEKRQEDKGDIDVEYSVRLGASDDEVDYS